MVKFYYHFGSFIFQQTLNNEVSFIKLYIAISFLIINFHVFFGSVTKEIQRINSREIERNISVSASWHAQYKDSPYIFIGNIPYDLTEGDVITIFSQ